jgi:hypothetical protein
MTTNGVVGTVQGTTDHQKIMTGSETMNTVQGVDEAETEAGAGVVTRRIAEKIVKNGREINPTNARPGRQRRRG